MLRKKPDVDVILDVIDKAIEHYPDNQFLPSIRHQYMERGGLSRKQLEGLFGKAKKIPDMPVARLATLEAIIRKKIVRTKSEAPAPSPIYQRDEEAGKLIDEILEILPQHRRVLELKNKYERFEPLTRSEKDELIRFHKIAVSRKGEG